MSAAAAVHDAVREVAGLGEHPVTSELLLDDDLGIDSLDFVRLMQAVEERLDIVIDDAAAASVRTVRDLVALADTTVGAAHRGLPPDPG